MTGSGSVKSFKHVRKGSNTLGNSLKQVRNSLKVARKNLKYTRRSWKHFRNNPKEVWKYLKLTGRVSNRKVLESIRMGLITSARVSNMSEMVSEKSRRVSNTSGRISYSIGVENKSGKFSNRQDFIRKKLNQLGHGIT